MILQTATARLIELLNGSRGNAHALFECMSEENLIPKDNKRRQKKSSPARWQVVLQDPSGRISEENDSFKVTLTTAPEDLLDSADDSAA